MVIEAGRKRKINGPYAREDDLRKSEISRIIGMEEKGDETPLFLGNPSLSPGLGIRARFVVILSGRA